LSSIIKAEDKNPKESPKILEKNEIPVAKTLSLIANHLSDITPGTGKTNNYANDIINVPKNPPI
jgi:hypothetical protein